MIDSMVFDIIYMIAIFFGSFFIIFHLHLWIDNREKLGLKGSSNLIPTMSLIVPAYNEGHNIEKTLDSLKGLEYPEGKLEIIVVDDGSTDSTLELARKKAKEFRNMKVLTKKNSGKASALNFGMSKSRGKYVAVVDADTLLAKDALINSVRYFDDDSVGAVTSHVLCSRRDRFWERMQNLELMMISFSRKLEEYANIIWVTPGPLSVYRKDILEKIGGFDEKILVEDVEVAWKLNKNGYKVRMALDAFSYSLYPSSFSVWWKQRLRWTIGGIQTLVKYKSSIKDMSNSVGSFFVPNAFLGYSLAVITMGLFAAVFAIGSAEFLAYIAKAYSVGANPFGGLEFYYYADCNLILGVIVMALTLPLAVASLRMHKGMFRWRDIPVFLFIYPILYSFVTVCAIYKYARGQAGWMTK